jgi:hypothetical protein
MEEDTRTLDEIIEDNNKLLAKIRAQSQDCVDIIQNICKEWKNAAC